MRERRDAEREKKCWRLVDEGFMAYAGRQWRKWLSHTFLARRCWLGWDHDSLDYHLTPSLTCISSSDTRRNILHCRNRHRQLSSCSRCKIVWRGYLLERQPGGGGRRGLESSIAFAGCYLRDVSGESWCSRPWMSWGTERSEDVMGFEA